MEIDRSLLPTTLSLSYVRSVSYVSLSLNILDLYNWTSVFVLLDKNSSPINIITATALVDRLGEKRRGVHTFRSVTSNANTTFTELLLECRGVSRSNGITNYDSLKRLFSHDSRSASSVYTFCLTNPSMAVFFLFSFILFRPCVQTTTFIGKLSPHLTVM